jgi:hypothetical protein
VNSTALDDIEIEYGRIDDASRRFGFRRSMIYVLLQQGLIKSRIVRPKGSTGTGIRLIDFNSIREFLAGAPEKPSKQISKTMAKRGKLPRKKRNGESAESPNE